MTMDSIEIDGSSWDVPVKEDLTKWNYKEWKEGRSLYKEFWVERYVEEKRGEVSRICSCLQMKNGTSATLDGHKLKDLEGVRRFFAVIDELRA